MNDKNRASDFDGNSNSKRLQTKRFTGIYPSTRALFTQPATKLLLSTLAVAALLGACNTQSPDAIRKQADVEMKAAHFDAAEKLLNSALELDQRGSDNDRSGMISDLVSLGMVAELKGKNSEAQEKYKKAVDIAKKAAAPKLLDLAKALDGMSNGLTDQGQLTEAEPILQRSLELREDNLPAGDKHLALSRNSLGRLYYAAGYYRESEPLLIKSLAEAQTALGQEDIKVAEIRNNLGCLYVAEKKYAQAEPLIQWASTIYEKVYASDHPEVASILNNLAELDRCEGKLQEAEPLYKRALSIYEKANGPDSIYAADAMNNLALLYSQENKSADAEPLFKRAIEIYKKAYGPSSPEVTRGMNNYASLLRHQQPTPGVPGAAPSL